jgi:hypothetical protein
MKREDFIFSIGYQGDSAIVDFRAAKRHGSLSAVELAEKGLYRAGFCSAMYDGDEDAMRQVVAIYNRVSGASLEGVEAMKRLLGVFSVPDSVSKVTRI